MSRRNVEGTDTFNGHIKTAQQRTTQTTAECGDWYTGRWWLGCYIWYSEERTGTEVSGTVALRLYDCGAGSRRCTWISRTPGCTENCRADFFTRWSVSSCWRWPSPASDQFRQMRSTDSVICRHQLRFISPIETFVQSCCICYSLYV